MSIFVGIERGLESALANDVYGAMQALATQQFEFAHPFFPLKGRHGCGPSQEDRERLEEILYQTIPELFLNPEEAVSWITYAQYEGRFAFVRGLALKSSGGTNTYSGNPAPFFWSLSEGKFPWIHTVYADRGYDGSWAKLVRFVALAVPSIVGGLVGLAAGLALNAAILGLFEGGWAFWSTAIGAEIAELVAFFAGGLAFMGTTAIIAIIGFFVFGLVFAVLGLIGRGGLGLLEAAFNFVVSFVEWLVRLLGGGDDDDQGQEDSDASPVAPYLPDHATLLYDSLDPWLRGTVILEIPRLDVGLTAPRQRALLHSRSGRGS